MRPTTLIHSNIRIILGQVEFVVHGTFTMYNHYYRGVLFRVEC